MKKLTLSLSAWLLFNGALFSGQAQQPNAPAPKPAPAAGATATGALSGRVFDDAGEPAPDANITLNVIGGSGGGRSTTSDDEGKFSFSGLPLQQYVLTVRAPGYFLRPGSVMSYRSGDTATITLVKGGVITGRVTNAAGEPVVAVKVSAQLARDATGRSLAGRSGSYSYTQLTDDRGIYRLYGLMSGHYLVVANSPGSSFTQLSAYENEMPTFYPSAPREAAQEVAVRAGEETSGIDIRYRSERGHLISGKLTGAIAANSYVSVLLRHALSGAPFNTTSVRPESGNGFAFYGIPDGEYEITAQRNEAQANGAASEPQRLNVKGADVTGLTLELLPLGALAGRIVAANATAETACPGQSAFGLAEAAVFAHRAEPRKAGQTDSVVASARVNNDGEFVLRGLAAGRYYLSVSSRNERWYIHALTLKSVAAADAARNAPARETDLARAGLPLKVGESLTGVTVTFMPGAATLLGRVVSAEGALPEPMRVYLVPLEKAAADEVLRYAESVTASGGRFAFTRLAPGRYRLVAEPLAPDEPRERRTRLAAWDQLERARLRRVAEAAAQELELKACQNVQDYELRLDVKK